MKRGDFDSGQSRRLGFFKDDEVRNEKDFIGFKSVKKKKLLRKNSKIAKKTKAPKKKLKAKKVNSKKKSSSLKTKKKEALKGGQKKAISKTKKRVKKASKPSKKVKSLKEKKKTKKPKTSKTKKKTLKKVRVNQSALKTQTEPLKKKRGRKPKKHINRLLAISKSETRKESEVILTDAEGRRYCRVSDCDQMASVLGHCRFHYLLFWKKIQMKKKILSEGKLKKYVEEISSQYPDKFLQLIRNDLSDEKKFLQAIQELELDEPEGHQKLKKNAQTFMDDISNPTTSDTYTTSPVTDDNF